MALPTSYAVGTASVNASETAVTGQGTTWLTSGLRPGDLFTAAGLSVRIASVNSNTSLTLAYPWPGSNRSAAAYEVRYTPDAERVMAASRTVIDMLGSGGAGPIAALTPVPQTFPYYVAPGVATLAQLTPLARQLLASTTPQAMRQRLELNTEGDLWDRLNAALAALETAAGGVKVDPVTLTDVTPSYSKRFRKVEDVNPDWFARGSTGTYWDASGVLRTAAANVPRIQHHPATGAWEGLLLEGASTNLVTARKHNPTDLTGLSGTGISRASIVNDVAELAAAGLSAVCTNGQVYRIDNSDNSSDITIFVGGPVANTSAHSVSAFWRGTGQGRIRLEGGSLPNVNLPARYERTIVPNVTPDTTARRMIVSVAAGAIVYFILPQLETATFASSPIPGETLAAVTRAQDQYRMPIAGLMPHNQREATFLFEAGPVSQNIGYNLGAIDSGTRNAVPNIRMSYQTSVRASARAALSGEVVTTVNQGGAGNVSTPFRVAISYNGNTIRSTSHGAAPATGTSPTSTADVVFSRVILGDGAWFSEPYAKIQGFHVFPRAFPALTLQAMTA